MIASIATCHGGTIEGEKDTISRLPGDTLNFGDVRYRPKLIAAILRLADELGEDSSRASQFGLSSPEALPKGCLIYHRYASSLVSVNIDQSTHEIGLSFKIGKEEGMEQYILDAKPVYLLDYIHQRTLKAYREMVYCSRFMRELSCRFDSIRVQVDAFCDPSDFKPIKSILYRLSDLGYPSSEVVSIAALAPQLQAEPGGSTLADIFSSQCETCEVLKS
jgi:hypothetical protein